MARLTSAARREIAQQRLEAELEADLADYERGPRSAFMREVIDAPVSTRTVANEMAIVLAPSSPVDKRDASLSWLANNRKHLTADQCSLLITAGFGWVL